MNRQESLTGRVSVVNDDQLASIASAPPKPYPLGLPRRIVDAVERVCRELTDSAFKPHEVTNMTPSDVPGVLIAAGVDEIYASLGRIERAKGFAAAEAAYHALLRRALADGRDDIAREISATRERIVRAREYESKHRAPVSATYTPPSSGLQQLIGSSSLGSNALGNRVSQPTTRVRDLMQQKADEAQRDAQAAALAEPAENARKRDQFNAMRDQQAAALADFKRAEYARAIAREQEAKAFRGSVNYGQH